MIGMQQLLGKPKLLTFLFALLLLPALFINLGAHHLFIHTDEGRRALVALEMILQNQYLAPTLNGEWYYEKPPLFNWLIVASFKVVGAYSAFAVRLPMVLSTLLYTWMIYRLMREVSTRQIAVLTAVATVTSGRILLYDSFLGLIDVWFSALIFLNFMLFYLLGKKQKWIGLFVLTYLVAAAAYLTKGLPALVFQFFTIISWAVYTRNWKFVFHPANFLGVFIFLVPVGLYYFLYESVNPGSFLTVMEYTWFQSSQRTPIEHSVWDTLTSLLTFPLENLYHFAPWTVLVVALFSKEVIRELWSNDFLRYAIIVFAFNIVVYWISPGVYPRYLFMFLPLGFAVLIHAYLNVTSRLRRGVDVTLMVAMGAVVLLMVVGYFYLPRGRVDYFSVKWAFTLAPLALLYMLFLKVPAQRLLVLGCFMLVVRVGYNFMLLPNRDMEGRGFAEGAEEVLRLAEGAPLYVLAPSYCHDATSFMISRERGEVLQIVKQMEEGSYYIIHEGGYEPERQEAWLTFGTRGTHYKLMLVSLRK